MTGRVFQTANGGPAIKIQSVPLFLVNDILSSLPPPTPKRVMVDGPDGTPVETISTDETDKLLYELELEKYAAEVQRVFLETVICEGVALELDEAQLKQVSDYRARMLKRGITKLPEDDKYLFICYLLIGNHSEVGRLTDQIIGMDAATEKAFKQMPEKWAKRMADIPASAA